MGNRYFVTFVSLFAIVGLVTVACSLSKNTTLVKTRKIDGGASRRAKPVIINKQDNHFDFFKRSTHSVNNLSPSSHQKQIIANTKFTNAGESDKKRKKKRTLCSCEDTSCCEEDCEEECSDPCPCPTSLPAPSTRLIVVPTRPPQRPIIVAQPNTPPVYQPVTNNVPANTGTIGLHPGIPGGAGPMNANNGQTVNTITGLHPGIPSSGSRLNGLVNQVNLQPPPPENFLIRIPQNQGQSMAKPNLLNLPNQPALIPPNQNLNLNPNPVINVPINTNPPPIRYSVPNQPTTYGYPNTNQANFGPNSLNYPQNQPIYSNVAGNQALNYGNNQRQNYANQRSVYANQALPNNIPGNNYVNPAINQGNNYGTPSVNPQGTNSGNNQASNTNNQVPNNANQVDNTETEGPFTAPLGPNQVPLSAVRVPSSLNQNPQTSENSGNSANPGNANPGSQAPANTANQENNPFAPGKTLPASVTNPSTNPAVQTNPGGSTNPQSGNPASTANQANNPFAPGGALTSSTKNPSTNPAVSTNPAGSNNMAGQNNPGGSANPQVGNSNQANNPFTPGGTLTSSTTNPSANKAISTNSAGSSNQVAPANQPGSANPTGDPADSNEKSSSSNNNSPKTHLFADRSPSENTVKTPKKKPSDETHYDQKEHSSNRQRQKSDSSGGQQSEDWDVVDNDGQEEHPDKRPKPSIQKQSKKAPDKTNKSAPRKHLKKLVQEFFNKLMKHETAGSSREMAESSLIVKMPKSKRRMPSRKRDKKGVRPRAFVKRRKVKRQKSLKVAGKKIINSERAKASQGRTPWEKVWKKFTGKTS